jgi:L-iditol 2-dehydrogenase
MVDAFTFFDISLERLAKSKWAGPDICIDSSTENLEKRVSEETNVEKADVVIVACSSGRAQEEGLKLVARRGNINFFGGLPKDNPFIKFDSNILHYNEIYAVGTHGSSPRHNRMALDLIATGRVSAKELITHHLPLEKVLEGIDLTG